MLGFAVLSEREGTNMQSYALNMRSHIADTVNLLDIQ